MIYLNFHLCNNKLLFFDKRYINLKVLIITQNISLKNANHLYSIITKIRILQWLTVRLFYFTFFIKIFILCIGWQWGASRHLQQWLRLHVQRSRYNKHWKTLWSLWSRCIYSRLSLYFVDREQCLARLVTQKYNKYNNTFMLNCLYILFFYFMIYALHPNFFYIFKGSLLFPKWNRFKKFFGKVTYERSQLTDFPYHLLTHHVLLIQTFDF